MKSQSEQVLAYIKEHGSITTFDAYQKLHITRLAARIWDLKHKGVEITTKRVYKAENGKITHWDVYALGGTDEGLNSALSKSV